MGNFTDVATSPLAKEPYPMLRNIIKSLSQKVFDIAISDRNFSGQDFQKVHRKLEIAAILATYGEDDFSWAKALGHKILEDSDFRLFEELYELEH